MTWFGIILIVVALVLFIQATEKIKSGEFGQVSWYLLSLGIYQWGQAIVLCFFWILFGLACISLWTPSQALLSYIVFHIIRAMVEIILTLASDYQGLIHALPHTGSVMSIQQRMQLYRLSQGLIIIVGVILLLE
jgi:hypothetical protein